MAAKPLIVIVGCTASGKSDLAVLLAQKYEGEIICADSRTIYKGMDIGTAKPSKKDRKRIKHHLLDIIEPNEAFNVSEFKKRATEAMEKIYQKGKLPIVVGGTGLYVDSLLFDYQFSLLGAERDGQNPRHLKKTDQLRPTQELSSNILVIGLITPVDELKARIKKRIEEMLEAGLEREVKNLAQEYGWDAPGMNAIAYKQWRPYLNNEQTFDQLIDKLFKDNWQYARRQKTWFARNQEINWITSVNGAVRLVHSFLVQ